jgi:hypothetical protein
VARSLSIVSLSSRVRIVSPRSWPGVASRVPSASYKVAPAVGGHGIRSTLYWQDQRAGSEPLPSSALESMIQSLVVLAVRGTLGRRPQEGRARARSRHRLARRVGGRTARPPGQSANALQTFRAVTANVTQTPDHRTAANTGKPHPAKASIHGGFRPCSLPFAELEGIGAPRFELGTSPTRIGRDMPCFPREMPATKRFRVSVQSLVR